MCIRDSPDGEDFLETVDTKGESQYLAPETEIEARYLRVWGKGHYIENTNSAWKGYSSGVLFTEIEVIASVEQEQPAPDPDPGDDEEMVDANIMTGLIPTSNTCLLYTSYKSEYSHLLPNYFRFRSKSFWHFTPRFLALFRKRLP